jgi:hypothetical protein
MKRFALAVLVAAAGCGTTKPGTDSSADATADADGPAQGSLDAPSEVVTLDGGADGLGDAAEASDGAATGDASDGPVSLALPVSCASDTNMPPKALVCTGLYADIATKQINPGIAAYAPAVPLWSDGATKQRWIYLPRGSKIDNSNPNEWVFPVGTKVWKEFSRDGTRVETRLWQKVDATYWVDAAYAWSADESTATRSDGGDIPWGDGGTYHIPTPDECQQCHRGRSDRILGFEQGLLGMAGATGLTLGQLAANGQLTVPPPAGLLVIGDDGTGLAAPALAWLHVNCGTTCHNQNSSSTAWASGLFMRLDTAQLDGRSVKGFDTLTTAIGVAAVSPGWKGKTRIVPHNPAQSLLYQLISHRGTGNQMPPIATNVVDQADIPLVEAWIETMAPLAVDGGTDGEPGSAGTGGGQGGAGGRGGAGGHNGTGGSAGGGGSGGSGGAGGAGGPAGGGGAGSTGAGGAGGSTGVAGASGAGGGGSGGSGEASDAGAASDGSDADAASDSD